MMDINYKEVPATHVQVQDQSEKGFLKYRSGEIPTWCPGCGYFGITKAIQQSLDQLHIRSKDLVVVSGIGCAGRFPFFMQAYGVHCIHGRTLPVATGIKMANEKLHVLVLSGDGDTLSIGISHFIHTIRRNIDLTYILFDNSIYGLTKGQTSPTSPVGFKTKTTPEGSSLPPMNPLLLALSSGVKYAGRSFAGNVQEMTDVITGGIQYKGFSLVHVYSPCVTFDHQYILYKTFPSLLKPVEQTYNASTLSMAISRAQDDIYSTGIFYKE